MNEWWRCEFGTVETDGRKRAEALAVYTAKAAQRRWLSTDR